MNHNHPVGRSWHKNQEIGKGCFAELVRREREREAKSMALAAEAQTAVDKKRRRRKQEEQSWIDRAGGGGCGFDVML